MPAPFQRSRSMRRIKTGKGVRFERRKKGKRVRCALCGMPLNAKQGGSKTEKVPNRKYGGHLCHFCAERVIRWKAWMKSGVDVPIPPSLRAYLK